MTSKNPYIFVEGGAGKDWRAFENGEPQVVVGTGLLPQGCDYAEGLHTYAVSPQTWVKTLTVARGGEGHASQHLIRVAARTGEDGWAVVEISDDGAGIPRDVLPRLFEPFCTTRAAGVGTGLDEAALDSAELVAVR